MRELLQNGAPSVGAHSEEFMRKDGGQQKNANLESGVAGNESHVYPETNIPSRHLVVNRQILAGGGVA
jgi:hypothetical protein